MYGYYYAQRYGLLNEDTTALAIGTVSALASWTSNLVAASKGGWDYGSNTAAKALTLATSTSNTVASLSNTLLITTLNVSYISNLAVTTASNLNTVALDVQTLSNALTWASNTLVTETSNLWSSLSNCCATNKAIATFASNTVVIETSNLWSSLSNCCATNGAIATFASNTVVIETSNLWSSLSNCCATNKAIAMFASNTVVIETSNLWSSLSNCCATNGAIATFASNTVVTETSNLWSSLSNCCATNKAIATFASNAASYASNTLRSMYDPTDGSITVGTPSAGNVWSMYTTSNGTSNTLVFESTAGTKVSLTDNFTSSVLNFTGSHRCSYVFDATPIENDAMDPYVGCIVVSTGRYKNADDMTMYDVNDALPIVDLACSDMDKRVFGVVAGFDDGTQKPIYKLANLNFQCGTPVKKAIINSTGEGAIRVCSIAGDITNGDLIVSSRVPGCGMRQPDDIVRACTVAKSTCTVNWQDERSLSQYIHGSVVYEDTPYVWALLGCLYAL